MCAWSWLS
jgi:hypothetical protein